MKKILLPTIVIILIIFGAPYITGKVAETQIHSLVDQLPTNNGSIDILNYERGFRKTDSIYKYTLAPQHQLKLGELTSIDLQCNIDHGVIGINYQCHIINNEWYSNLINVHFNDNDPITILGSANALGKIIQTISIEEINDLPLEPNNGSINIAKTELKIVTDKDLSHYDLEGDTAKLFLILDSEQINLTKIDLGGNIKQLDNGLLTGDFNFSASNIELKDINNTVNISGLKSITSASQKDINIDSKTEISIDAMTLANAPFDVANDLKFAATLNGINKEAFVEYQAFTNDIRNQSINANGSTPTVDPIDMVPIFERLLTEDFNLGFDLSGKLDGNDNSMSLDFSIIQSLIFNDVIALTYDPQQPLNKINIILTANFNEDTVNQDPKLAASVLDSPLFEKVNEDYKMNLVLGPEIQLNNQPTTIKEMKKLIRSNVAK